MPGRLPYVHVLRAACAALAVFACSELVHAEGGDGGGGGSGAGAGAGSGAGAGTGSGTGAGSGASGAAGGGSSGAGTGSSGAGQGHGEGEGAPAPGGVGVSASPGASASPGVSGSAHGSAGSSAGSAGIAGALSGSWGGGEITGNARSPRPSQKELQYQQGVARDAVARGQVQPLDSILRSVEISVPGSVLSARLRQTSLGVWIYVLVILTAEGHYREVIVNAARNNIISVK